MNDHAQSTEAEARRIFERLQQSTLARDRQICKSSLHPV
jgi:hypothetical protein